MFNDIIKGLSDGMGKSGVYRKITHTNPDKNKEALYFEVGKRASKYNEELGVISAIMFDSERSKVFGDVIHNVYIRRPNGEEYLWKELWSDRVIERDIDLD